MITLGGNKMPKAFRFACWSCLPLLLVAGCVIENPELKTVAAPTFSPLAGTYATALDVVITTATSGATIRFTTDGSTPSATNGTAYSTPVPIADSLTIKAIATKSGWTDSSVSTGVYTISTVVATPVFSPGPGTYAGSRDVAIVSLTVGASIRYTTDGSTPTETVGTLYAGPVHITETLTLKAVAYLAGATTSAVTSGLYTIIPQVAAPAFVPPAGAYADPQDVAITTATPGATVRYTTDGSTPTGTHGTVYAAPVHVAASLTLKAVGSLAGWADSPVTTGDYEIGLFVAAPIFSPAPGTFGSAQNVTITTTTPGATIRYTTDGTTPTETVGTVYASPVPIAATLTLKAVAYRSGWTTSTVTTGTYTIQPVYKQYAYTADSQSHAVSAFAIDPAAGTLTTVAGSPFTVGGTFPISLAAHPSGKFLYVLNNASRDISIFAIAGSTGVLTAASLPCPTGGTYPTWIAIDPAGKFIYVADLVSNAVTGFTVDAATGALTPFLGSPFLTGTAPISLAVDPSGKFVYVANQGTHNVSAFTLDAATGALAPVIGSPFVTGGMSPTMVAVDALSKFVYVTNGSSGNISAFAIDAASGALSVAPGSPFTAGGVAPAAVAVDPTGRFAYIGSAGTTISGFAIDAATGALAALAGSPFAAEGIYPRSIAFEYSGKFACVANSLSATLSAFAIDPATGALGTVTGSPYPTANGPYFVVTVRVAQ
jgi:6-phosphogluconolactonase (cycloisomerase 2 family)